MLDFKECTRHHDAHIVHTLSRNWIIHRWNNMEHCLYHIESTEESRQSLLHIAQSLDVPGCMYSGHFCDEYDSHITNCLHFNGDPEEVIEIIEKYIWTGELAKYYSFSKGEL